MTNLKKKSKCLALALIQLINESQLVGFISRLKGIATTIQQNSELSSILADPAISKEIKLNILEKIFTDTLEENDLFKKIFASLASKHSLVVIGHLADEIEKVHNKQSNLDKVQVFSAQKSSDSEISKIKEFLQNQNMEKQVNLSISIKPELLAGFRLQSDEYIYDNSLKSHLQKIKELS